MNTTNPTSWPDAPSEMTVTSLLNIEACPRQWALRNAEYPDIWDGLGYPDRPILAALSGTIVHLAVEKITDALVAEGCTSVLDASAGAVLERLGGLTNIVENSINETLNRNSNNPRFQRLSDSLKSSLDSRTPQMRTYVQRMAGRIDLVGGTQNTAEESETSDEADAQPSILLGTHSEVLVRAPELNWKGKIDLLTLSSEDCELLDFKTGQPKENDKFQIRVYALLWSSDTKRNPNKKLPNKLRLVYPNQEVDLEPPSIADLRSLEEELSNRTSAAVASLTQDPPEARINIENCGHCSVRHLCYEYWNIDNQTHLKETADLELDFVDMQLKVTNTKNPTLLETSVEISKDADTGKPAVVKIPPGSTELQVGDRIRLLNVRLSRDDLESGDIRVTMGPNSELFIVSETES